MTNPTIRAFALIISTILVAVSFLLILPTVAESQILRPRGDYYRYAPNRILGQCNRVKLTKDNVEKDNGSWYHIAGYGNSRAFRMRKTSYGFDLGTAGSLHKTVASCNRANN